LFNEYASSIGVDLSFRILPPSWQVYPVNALLAKCLVVKVATSAAPGRSDRGDVDLFHPHHRIKCALCFIAASG
jgi:hypothetical protein